jgi:[ribosomal protein S5]-alanine N-acetyltransferase
MLYLKPDELREVLRDLPELRTDRLLLRKIRREDRDDIFAYASRPEVTRYTYFSYHRSLAETDDWLEKVLAGYDKGEDPVWAVVSDDAGDMIGAIGMLHFSALDGRAEVGYAIHPDYWGRGIAAEALRAVMRFGFERLGLVRVEARCSAEHQPSWRVMEKAGMRFEGVLRQQAFIQGRHHDVKLYAALRNEWS